MIQVMRPARYRLQGYLTHKKHPPQVWFNRDGEALDPAVFPWAAQGIDLPVPQPVPSFFFFFITLKPRVHPGGNPGANLKPITHRCHPILVAFLWELTKETTYICPWVDSRAVSDTQSL